MTKTFHRKAIKLLKEINNFKLESSHKIDGDIVTTKIKHQLIQLGDLTLVVSGSIEQKHSKHYSADKSFFVISLYDENNDELKFTPNQNEEFKNILKEKLEYETV